MAQIILRPISSQSRFMGRQLLWEVGHSFTIIGNFDFLIDLLFLHECQLGSCLRRPLSLPSPDPSKSYVINLSQWRHTGADPAALCVLTF